MVPEERVQRDIAGVHKRLDRHDARIQTIESNMHHLDKVVALAVNKLDRVIELITSISVTVRNSAIGVIIGAVVWALAQMGGVM